jgi:DNA N-6-adenine-methyltransferase (Dam)
MVKSRILYPSNHWSTPKLFYDKLVDQFGELFDPCPIATEITDDNNGLLIPWKDINFVNPSYSLKEKTDFVEKAISEYQEHDNISILLLPVSTSTKLYHLTILPNFNVYMLFGRLKFEGINSSNEHVNPGVGINSIPDAEHLPKIKNGGTFDSMICITKNYNKVLRFI